LCGPIVVTGLCHKIRVDKRGMHARRLSQTCNHKPRSQVPLTGGLLVHRKSVAIVGYGAVGRYLHRLFPEAVVYDEPLGMGDREEVNRSQFAFDGPDRKSTRLNSSHGSISYAVVG